MSRPKRILAAVLNLFSFCGGHFLLRRWDLGLLFLGVAFATGAGFMASLPLLIPGTGDAALRALIPVFQVALGVLVFVATVSAVTGLLVKPDRLPNKRLGIAGAFLTTLIGVWIIGQPAWFLYELGHLDEGALSESTDMPHEARASSEDIPWTFPNLSETIHLGSGKWVSRSAPEPPPGTAKLQGRVIRDGAPVSGVRIQLAIDGKYRTPEVVTDDSGRYEVSIAPGEWSLNAIFIPHWNEKPPHAEFAATVPALNKLREKGTKQFIGEQSYRNDIKMIVGPEETQSLPDIELINRFSIEPARNVEDLSDACFDWPDVENAGKYQVYVKHARKMRSSTHYHPANDAITDTSRLCLGGMETKPSEKKKNYYVVNVAALNEEGHLLEISERMFDQVPLTLPEGIALAERSRSSGCPAE